MKKSKVEFIDNSEKKTCRTCHGTGKLLKVNGVRPFCADCNGTGIYVEPNFHMIATKPDGTKIGFQVDSYK